MAHRRTLRWVVPLCVVVGLALSAAGGAGARTSDAGACDNQANDTAAKLLPCITQDDLEGYMGDLWDIAVANPSPADNMPSRNAGEPGYLASALYVKNLMEQWGYNASLQTYKFDYYAYTAEPTFSEDTPVSHDYVLDDEWSSGQSTGSASAAIEPAGGIVPPTPTTSSTSGCTAADFSTFHSGHIALIQRGGCNFGVKVLNAKAAGATGVIVFNEGNPGRTGLLFGSLLDGNDQPFVPQIPVAFTSFAVGTDLLTQYHDGAAPVVSLTISAIFKPNQDDYNVIAESKGGDKNHVVVVDAHLDAIYGAGMLDNASGSVTILDIARMMRNVNPTNKLRFIWFGGEELGLLGSHHYVSTLPSNDLSHIGYDLDADVTATPNYTLGILDPAARDLFSSTGSETYPNRVYKASLIGRDAGIAYLDSIHKHHELFSPVGTDAFEFNKAGIPASGVLTGQDCCKSPAEVDLFGGMTGNFEGVDGHLSYPPLNPNTDGGCVDNAFRWCDNLDNNDFEVMTWVSRAFANMVLRMAFDTKVMSSSTSVVYNKDLPIADETSRHFKAG